MAEVRKTIAVSLGAAFGFIIALLWNNVVMGALSAANVQLGATVGEGQWVTWAYGVVTALVLTIVMIVLIVMVGRWGGK